MVFEISKNRGLVLPRRNKNAITSLATFRDKDLEKQYRESQLPLFSFSSSRLILIAGGIFFSVGYFDYKYGTDSAAITWSLIFRAIVLVMAIITAVVISQTKSKRAFYASIVIFPLFLIGAYICLLTKMKAPGFAKQAMAIMVILFFTTALPLQWLTLVIMHVVAVVSFLIGTTLYLEHVPVIDYIEISSYLLLMLVFTALYHYRSNVVRREKYLWEEQLQHQSITDKLTGLYNRLWFDYTISEWCSRSEEDYQFSLVIFDIDDFKKINDTYGHLVGDQVLIECARLVKMSIRATDMVARWGGEEFVLLLPQVEPAKAVSIAEHLRSTIEKNSFKGVGSLTCSFGVVHWQAGEDAHNLITRADTLLYQAKNTGKNRVLS